MEPKKILVPYDGSKQSDKALKKAIELTELIKQGGTMIEINMLHVVAEIYVPPMRFDRDVNIKSKITGERLYFGTISKRILSGDEIKSKEDARDKEIERA